MQPSRALYQLLDKRFSTTCRADTMRTPQRLDGADRYVLASLLQKAVRRGDLEAARCAGHGLLAQDPVRLWRRLRATALEDIGVADPDTAAELVCIATSREARTALGGNGRALDYAFVRACAAPKDRTPDHLNSIVERESDTAREFEQLKAASENALCDVVVDTSANWTRRAHAAAALHRRAQQVTSQKRQELLAPLFSHLLDSGVPDLFLAACSAYTVSDRDILPYVAALAWTLRNAAGQEGEIIDGSDLVSDSVDGIPEYAFDPLHTRIGRRAVDLWRRCYFLPPPWTTRQISMALWNIESAACARRIRWPLGEEIRRRAYRADLESCGVPIDRQSSLYVWVLAEYPALRTARLAAWRNAIAA